MGSSALVDGDGLDWVVPDGSSFPTDTQFLEEAVALPLPAGILLDQTVMKPFFQLLDYIAISCHPG